MTLKFSNSYGVERYIGEPASLEEAGTIIQEFLKEHQYKSYYTITRLATHWYDWVNKTSFELKYPRIEFDVGSHTEFFYLDGAPSEIINKFK